MKNQTKEVTAEVAAYLQIINSGPSFSTLTLEQFRIGLVNAVKVSEGEKQPVNSITDHVTGSGVPFRIYSNKASAPALLYFHGGSWVRGSIDTHDGICRDLCLQSGYTIIAVGYRKAPEHPYPAALVDGLAVLEALTNEFEKYKLDPENIAIGGDSSGGNLAIAVCLNAMASNKKITTLFWLIR